MSLSAKLIKQFQREVFRQPRAFDRDIYNIKTVHDRIGSSILFSCRFKHMRRTFIFSACIQLKEPCAHVRTSIHLLCPNRIFSQEMFRTYMILPERWTMTYVMREEKFLNYYKRNRVLPYTLMWNMFHRFAAKELIDFLNVLYHKGNDYD